MSDALELASDLLKISRQLNRDRFSEELETYCWPLVELIEWEDPIDVCTFNAALYYGETLQEQTPAHLLSGSVYNEWVAAIKADRFPAYRAQEHAINQRAQAVLRSPLIGEIDPFWLMFPNNINLNNWNSHDIAALMAISAYSRSIKTYKPLGVLLYIYGHPVQWVSANPDDPIGQAAQGLTLLAQPLKHITEMSYKQGTFQ